jgi:hypothetical protein
VINLLYNVNYCFICYVAIFLMFMVATKEMETCCDEVSITIILHVIFLLLTNFLSILVSMMEKQHLRTTINDCIIFYDNDEQVMHAYMFSPHNLFD